MNLYDFKVEKADGSQFNLSELKGRVVLVVNVASECGFTPQYEQLQALYQKYQPKGLTVLGFPCNQFGNQESGTNEEIQSFCSTKFRVNFPVLAKIEVNGTNTAPLYMWLKDSAPGLLGSKNIKWNFTKFLIDSKGVVQKRFAPVVNPRDIEADIEKLLT